MKMEESGIAVYLNGGNGHLQTFAVEGCLDERGGDEEASHKAFRGFFEHALEGFFQTTPEGKYLRANPALARIYGYESPKALMEALTDINVQLYVDAERRREFARLMREPGEVIGFESEVRRRDGTVIWIAENARVVRDEEGTPVLYEGTVQDITARKRAEFDLTTSQRFIERVTQCSPNILYVYDLIQQRYIYANGRIFKILGRTLDEFIGIGPDFLPKFSHPDDNPLLKQRALELSDAEDGDVFEYEFRLLHSDGSWRWMNAREMIFTRLEDGRPHEVIGTAQDITERRLAVDALLQSEERFRKLVEGADAIFCERDLDLGRFTYVGPQAKKLLGYPVERWYLHYFWEHHVHEEDRARVERFWREDAGTPGSHTIEYRLMDSSGRLVWVREFGHVTRSEDGRLILQGFMIDTTERYLAQMEIARSREQLRALSARLQSAREVERTRIAREIHDDLGGALTAIKMDVSRVVAACRGGREEPQRTEFMDERLSRTLELIDRTMESMRRIATELRPPLLDEFGIVAAIEWLTDDFAKRFGMACKLHNQWKLQGVRDQSLSTALFRIFQEMMTNVARHSEATSVVVSLMQDAENLLLRVSDNGRGITECERRDALGLLGMQERAWMFGGEVEIRGTAGKGTDVTLKVPLLRVAKSNGAPRKERLLS
jgi:two-component system sensor histidine kinase UhpB